MMKTFEQYTQRKPQVGDVYNYVSRETVNNYIILVDIDDDEPKYKNIAIVIYEDGTINVWSMIEEELLNRAQNYIMSDKELFLGDIKLLRYILNSHYWKRPNIKSVVSYIKNIIEDEDISDLLDSEELGLI